MVSIAAISNRCSDFTGLPQATLLIRSASAEETLTLTPDRARQRAEKSFKKEERGRDARNAMAEYEAQAAAIRKKTAHLKALRLAKEAQGLASDPDC
jgi:hypothetical protein